MQPDETGITNFQETLLQWRKTNARDYPWRYDRTPYRIAIAELMLRRTQADQVVAVYLAFLEEFPALENAAGADHEEVLRLLYPLGLAWRARNMVDFFRDAYLRFGNDLPLDADALRTLPGIGDYVGAAIVCFAGGQSEPLIDTNVVRVLGRVFGLRTDGEARRRADMRRLATRAVYVPDPASYHFALLDFAALVCQARKPQCHICPLHVDDQCEYYRVIGRVMYATERPEEPD